MNDAVHIDVDRLTRRNITLELMRSTFQGHRFTGHHDCLTAFILAIPHTEWTNAKRIPKRQQAVAGNQGHHSVGALHAFMHTTHRCEHIYRVEWQATRCFFKLVRQHIQQHFRVAVRVDVAVISVKQLRFELCCIRQVTVVRQHQTKGCINVKRLRFIFAESIASSRIAHLAKAYIAG